MEKYQNNKGMTLLELIISMAISAIVIVMVISFISGAFRVFRRTNDEVNLQMEAQTAVNQLINLSMEAKSISNKWEITANEDRYRITSGATGVSDWAVIWNKEEHKLYLAELSSTVVYETVVPSDENNLLAEYVEEFSIKNVDAEGKTIKLELTLSLGTDEYSVTRKVNLRNAR